MEEDGFQLFSNNTKKKLLSAPTTTTTTTTTTATSSKSKNTTAQNSLVSSKKSNIEKPNSKLTEKRRWIQNEDPSDEEEEEDDDNDEEDDDIVSTKTVKQKENTKVQHVRQKNEDKSKAATPTATTTTTELKKSSTKSSTNAQTEQDDENEQAEEQDEDDEDDSPPGSTPALSNVSFESLGLKQWLVTQCSAMGLKKPTDIQAHTVQAILKGQNVIGCAKTGSGKTAAFALPILHKLSEDPYGIYALVLTPTRELAFQIAEQFRVFGKPIGLRDAVIVGGVEMTSQALALSKKPHVVIATPGRLVDHLNSNSTFSLKNIKFLVLDEADRLLEPGFEDDLAVILSAVNTNKRQTLLFSATLTKNISDLERMSMTNAFHYETPSSVATVTTLDQRYIVVPAKVKDCYLSYLLGQYEDRSTIVFTSTCRSCETVSRMIKELGFKCVSLHSDLPQSERLGSLAKFRSSIVNILVATDVASRGLDIPVVKLVVNHDVPQTSTDYIHRVGRTARAGRGGMAVTFVTQYDVQLVQSIEEKINVKLTALPIKEDEALENLNDVTEAKRKAIMSMSESNFGEKKRRNKEKHSNSDGSSSSSSKEGSTNVTHVAKKVRKEKS